jgi:hypothetical protein
MRLASRVGRCPAGITHRRRRLGCFCRAMGVISTGSIMEHAARASAGRRSVKALSRLVSPGSSAVRFGVAAAVQLKYPEENTRVVRRGNFADTKSAQGYRQAPEARANCAEKNAAVTGS